LSECVKRNIEKCVRLINGWIINVMAKIRWYEGEINIHGCKEALALLRRVKKKSIHFWSLNKSFEWLIDITNKLLSTVTLIPSIVFNDSFGVGNCISWFEMKCEKWKEQWLRNHVYWIKLELLMPFWTKIHLPLGLKPLLLISVLSNVCI